MPTRSAASHVGRAFSGLCLAGLLVALVLVVFPELRPGSGGDDRPSYAGLTPAQPVQLSAADVGLTAPLLGSDRDPVSTLATPPDDAPLVTWWQDSAEPGAAQGQTVLTAHASAEAGGLTALADLTEGDHLDVATRTGTMRYEVTSVRTLGPDRLQRASVRLFDQDTGDGGLVAISTEQWDGSRYQRSVVVTAAPLGQPEG